MNETTKQTFTMELSAKWYLRSSADVDAVGKKISTPDFDTTGWYPATVPGTVMAALVENRVYKDPYVGLNMQKIPTEPFKLPWWYRKTFELDSEQSSQYAALLLDGINYKANLWLNGTQIARADEIEGTFRRFEIDVTGVIKRGENVLAVEVHPPQPGQYSIGFVDWNPAPPDQCMGLFRPVTLQLNRGVVVRNPFVQASLNLVTLKEAALTITADVENRTETDISGNLIAKFDDVKIRQDVTLKPHERKQVEFNSVKFEQLLVQNPRIWWPNNLGDPHLYELEILFESEHHVFDRQCVTFGIRDIQDYFNADGHRGFRVNGKDILIKGGGWVDDLLLQDTPQLLETQIRYVKHMNLNAIRLEGFWGKDHTLYDLCDRYGILVMVGWSCHWEHEEYLGKPCDEKYGGALTIDDFDMLANSFQDQVVWLRNHPSIFIWSVGSDKLPHPDLERRYVNILRRYDPTRNYLASTGGYGSETGVIVDADLVSEISGTTGMKMLGPYAYTPPVYWYTDTEFGGAYGFNSETGPGPQIPPIESIRKMIPEDQLWPIGEHWRYHCGRNEFNRLDRFVNAMKARYGPVDSIEAFVDVAQLMNYELMRPMFEAFQAHKFKTTGIIQWMLNSAWPEMYWQLYDSYLMPNGAFYGAKKACQPLHVLYRYGYNDIYLVNDKLTPVNDLITLIRVYDIHAREIYNKSVSVSIDENCAKQIWQLPDLKDISDTYFLDLRLFDADVNEIDFNFYWLSTQADVLDYEKNIGEFYYHTPSKAYADLSMLNQLPKIEIEAKAAVENDRVEVVLHNPTTKIAFFIELKLVGMDSGKWALPVFWDDNYISLLPGEKRHVCGSFSIHDKNETPVFEIRGWNVQV